MGFSAFADLDEKLQTGGGKILCQINRTILEHLLIPHNDKVLVQS
jgi:hypothetical protein